MKNNFGKILQEVEQAEIAKLKKDAVNYDIRPGFTIKVGLNIAEPGGAVRIQYITGLCVAIKRGGINSAFVVRKYSDDVGVERKIPFYLPTLMSLEVVRKGKVRRAKLYYMRNLKGKAARLKEVVDSK